MNIIYEAKTLFKRTSSGKINNVRIYTDGENVYRETNDDKVTKVNVVPKSNRTQKEQAKLMVDSEFKKKLRSGYRTDLVESEYEHRPMLAKVFHEKYVKYPAGVSPKLDGVRCLSYSGKLYSRTGKEFSFKQLIKEHIKNLKLDDMVLDGELYIHNISFSDIMRLVSPNKNIPEDENTLEYHIFDIIEPRCSYEQRMTRLEYMEKDYHDLYPNKKDRILKFVFYDVANNFKDIQRLHDIYAEKGYEGVMIRNINSKYKEGLRSSDLLKYKIFKDDEFKIVDFKEGSGNDKGAIIFIVKNNYDDRLFAVRPKLSIEERKRMFKKGKSYIGKMYTVRYQPEQGDDNLPRFPVGIAIRDYE